MPLDRQKLHVTSQLSSVIWQVLQMQPAFHSPNRQYKFCSPILHSCFAFNEASLYDDYCVEKHVYSNYHSTEAHNKGQHKLASVLKGY